MLTSPYRWDVTGEYCSLTLMIYVSTTIWFHCRQLQVKKLKIYLNKKVPIVLKLFENLHAVFLIDPGRSHEPDTSQQFSSTHHGKIFLDK